MNTFYVSKPITDALFETLRDDYKTYLQAMATASGMKLDAIKTLKIGNDYAAIGLQRPAILMDMVSMDIEDEGAGIVGGTMLFEVVFVIDSQKEDDLTIRTMCYADALVSMVTSDDYLGGDVVHASAKRIEYFPGGTGSVRYAVVDVEVALEVARS